MIRRLLIPGIRLLFFLFYTVNAQWMQITSPGGYLSSMVVKGNTIFAGTENGIFLSTDNGTSWAAVNSGLINKRVFSLAVLGDTVFAGTEKGVFISTDNGISWVLADSGLTNIKAYSLAANHDNIFAGTVGGVFTSTYNDTSWTVINSSLTDNSIRSLTVNGDKIYALASSGVFHSTDNGISWIKSANLPDLFHHIMSSAMSGETILVGTEMYDTSIQVGFGGDTLFEHRTMWGRVWYLNQDGEGWSTLNSTYYSITALAISGDNIFVGSHPSGLQLYTKIDGNWQLVLSGEEQIFGTDNSVQKLVVCNNYLFVQSSPDARFWRRPLSELITVSSAQSRPKKMQLLHLKLHTLNRSNTQMAVEFLLPHSDYVTVMMYNSAGKEYTSIVNQYLSLGPHRYFMDTHSFAQGCYVIKLQVGKDTYTQLFQIVH